MRAQRLEPPVTVPLVIAKPSWRFCCQQFSFSCVHTGRSLPKLTTSSAAAIDAAGFEVALGRRGAALREGEIVLVGAAIVGVAVDANVQRGLRLEDSDFRIESSFAHRCGARPCRGRNR